MSRGHVHTRLHLVDRHDVQMMRPANRASIRVLNKLHPGDAQLSILIGRKDLWHSGFGTASTLALLNHIFNQLDLYRAWVDVPEYNKHAREMFEHVGFIHEGTLRKSRPHHGARFDSVIMGMLRAEYERKYPHEEGQISHTV